MKDFLDKLAHAAQNTVREGFYNVNSDQKRSHTSPLRLQQRIQEENHAPIIAEVKLASPSSGRIRQSENLEQLATSLARGGAVALSVLTEPKYFSGSISNFIRIRDEVSLPLLMKDIVISPRQIDTAARYGGDEFAVVLPNTSLKDAVRVAERMVDVVADSPITWKKEQIWLSISVGVGQYSADMKPEDITSRSDQALYSAKQAGKNTVRIFEYPEK